MSVQTSVFPDEPLLVTHTPQNHYGWPVCVGLGNGSRLYLTEEQADRLSADLWNRHIEQEKAA